MKGFTLVEALIALSIFAILTFAIFAVMETGRGSWYTGDATAELRQEIIKAFATMEKELKETRGALLLDQDLAPFGVGSASTALTFRAPEDIDGLLTVINSSTGGVEWSDTITYALNGSRQLTRTHSGVTTILANDIDNLLFTRPATPPDILQVDIIARRTSPVGRQIQEAGQITIMMRN